MTSKLIDLRIEVSVTFIALMNPKCDFSSVSNISFTFLQTGNAKQSEAWAHKSSRIGSKTSISTQAVVPESHQSTTSAASQTRAKILKIFSNPEKVQIKQVANNDVRRKIQEAKLSNHESVSVSQSKPLFESQHPDFKIDTQNHLKRNHQNKRYLPIFLVRNGAVNLTREPGLSVELPKEKDHSIENRESLELKSNVQTLPSLSNFEPLTILKNVGLMVPRTIRKAHDEDTKQQSKNRAAGDQSRYLKKSTRIQTRAEEGSPDSKSASPGPEDLRIHELSGISQKPPTRRVVRLRHKSQSKQTSDDSGSNPESGYLTTTQFPEQTKKESRRGPGRALSRSPATSTEKPISTAERAEHNPPDIKPTIPSSPSRRLNLNTKQTTKTFETTSKEPPELGNNSDAKKFSKSPSRYRDNLNRTKSDLSSTGMPVPRLRTSSKFGIQAQNPVLVTTIPVPTTNFPTNKLEPSSRPASTKDGGIDRNDGDGDFELVNSSLRRRASKEDFFNHGLGFRGRRPSPTGIPEGNSLILCSNKLLVNRYALGNCSMPTLWMYSQVVCQ
ncbi:hypothetical protein QAD02_014299 [Eretmocerus hayati]|uniref:Uncharacterized protein n=1 Tax=Eretmocerus hayati TaxID=131215 RepID=A0ACC2P552_9HYME|nr:hypothetical protein QAD02_014299 [Eretmocerus hayati]